MIKICINIALAILIVCEVCSTELDFSTFSPSPSGDFDQGFVNGLSLSTHFSLSLNNTLSNDYMNSSVIPITYNYGFELGLFKSRRFSQMYSPPRTRIWQYGILLGSTNFRSSFKEENMNTLFIDDKEKVPYSTTRRLTHNTGFVTLRATTSIQFSFLPLKLLVVPGIKAGYRFSEHYEDYLSSESQNIAKNLPSHAILERNNNLTYIVDKQNQPQDYLYGLQFGVAYQWGDYNEYFFYNSHNDIWVGIEYIRANLLGSGVQNYLFFSLNFRYTI